MRLNSLWDSIWLFKKVKYGGKSNKKETEKPEDDFWQVDYLDSHSAMSLKSSASSGCDVCCVTRLVRLADRYVSISLVFGERADLADLTSVGTRFLHPRQTRTNDPIHSRCRDN